MPFEELPRRHFRQQSPEERLSLAMVWMRGDQLPRQAQRLGIVIPVQCGPDACQQRAAAIRFGGQQLVDRRLVRHERPRRGEHLQVVGGGRAQLGQPGQRDGQFGRFPPRSPQLRQQPPGVGHVRSTREQFRQHPFRRVPRYCLR